MMRFSPILLAGWLAALTPAFAAFSDGSLDPAFSGDGLVQTDFGNGLADQVLAVAVQPDGKTVAAGHSVVSGRYQVALARYTVDGSLDATFGTGGRIRIDVGPDNDVAHAVAVQPDGKIVIAGYTYTSGFEFLVMRFTAAGALDSTFGTNGKVTTALSSTVNRATALALQPDGKIVVAGLANIAGGQDFVVLRYTPSGALDTTFSGDGIAFTNLGGSTEQATSVLLQPDGKIVAAGFSSQGAWLDTALVRYTDAGALDTGFGTSGKAIISLSPQDDAAYAAALSPEGGILLTGSMPGVGGYSELVIARCTSSGVLDTGFAGGVGRTRAAELNASMVGRGLALQSDGKILFAGSTTSGGGQIVTGRLNPDGSGVVDLTFSGGVVRTPVGTGGAVGYAMALHADGRVAVAGVSNSASGGPDFTVAMYGVPRPEIAVAAPGGPLTDGTGSISLGAAPAGFSAAPATFTLTNPGTGPLTSLAVTKSGPDAAEFTLGALSATTIAPGGSATFTATFSPASAGAKSATLQIASNVDGAANPFDIALTARTLTTSEDTDGDGLNDAAEFRLVALGFNWQTAQPALVQVYQNSAAGAGLFRPSQVQAVDLRTPRLTRQPGTDLFTLEFGLDRVTESPPYREAIPLLAPQTTIEEGRYRVRFPSPGGATVLRMPTR